MTGGLPRGEGRTVLLVDDDEAFRRGTRRILERSGYAVHEVDDGEACLDALATLSPDAVLLDLNMTGLGGIETLRRLRELRPSLQVVMLTGESDVRTVVEAVQAGAFDYLQKPPDPTRLITTLHNAAERSAMTARLRELERDAAGEYMGMIGRSPPMIDLFRQLERIGPTDVRVLIGGESGSGKELVARALHRSSPRASGPFVAINCAAIAESVQESELFGHERGAFTGAVERRPGRFEQADGGTLFLDEVGELSASAQAQLLRVIQEQQLYRVGGTVPVDVDVRILAATHKDLLLEARQNRFREDLYYRLAVYEVDVPPLRDRRDDIPALAARFVRGAGQRYGRAGIRLGAAALDLLVSSDWPGNVRELQHAIERAVVAARTELVEPHDLPHRLRSHAGSREPSRAPAPAPAPAPAASLKALEREAIEDAMTRFDGNVSRVVRELGISRSTLYRRLREMGLR